MRVSGYFDLSEKIAIITGGSRGIGRAIAIAIAGAGAKVVLASRKQKGLDAVASEIRESGGDALPVATHTGDERAVEALVDKSVESYGGVDIVVNGAATNPHFGPLLSSEESQWDKIWDVNVKGYYRVARACTGIMRSRGGGKIINIASVAGQKPLRGMGIYCISKAAIIMLTKVLAMELVGDNIQVNAIAPGFVKTRFSTALWQNPEIHSAITRTIPQGRMAKPEEVAGIALYLASEASSYTTGETIVVDGGVMLGPPLSVGRE